MHVLQTENGQWEAPSQRKRPRSKTVRRKRRNRRIRLSRSRGSSTLKIIQSTPPVTRFVHLHQDLPWSTKRASSYARAASPNKTVFSHSISSLTSFCHENQTHLSLMGFQCSSRRFLQNRSASETTRCMVTDFIFGNKRQVTSQHKTQLARVHTQLFCFVCFHRRSKMLKTESQTGKILTNQSPMAKMQQHIRNRNRSQTPSKIRETSGT